MVAYSSEVLDRGSSSSNKTLRIGGYYDFGYTVVALLSNMVMNTIDFHYVVFFFARSRSNVRSPGF